MSKDWDSLSRSEKKEEAQKTLRKLKRQKSKMKKKIIIYLLYFLSGWVFIKILFYLEILSK
tara:strand:- start:245 stop:427 length:183 start_codon:yes stop_codon:yes gene_type:complete